VTEVNTSTVLIFTLIVVDADLPVAIETVFTLAAIGLGCVDTDGVDMTLVLSRLTPIHVVSKQCDNRTAQSRPRPEVTGDDSIKPNIQLSTGLCRPTLPLLLLLVVVVVRAEGEEVLGLDELFPGARYMPLYPLVTDIKRQAIVLATDDIVNDLEKMTSVDTSVTVSAQRVPVDPQLLVEHMCFGHPSTCLVLVVGRSVAVSERRVSHIKRPESRVVVVECEADSVEGARQVDRDDALSRARVVCAGRRRRQERHVPAVALDDAVS
jgi:hypothetical protein